MAPTDLQGIVIYRQLWAEEGTEAGMYGLRMRLFFSLGKRMCKRKLWQGVSVSVHGSIGEPGGCGLIYRRL